MNNNNLTIEDMNIKFVEKLVSDNKSVFKDLTTSKLRSLLDMVNHLYTQVSSTNSLTLTESQINELEYFKVKFAYEAGRERSVKDFLRVTQVRELLDVVIKDKSRKTFLNYCRYFEAIIAYAKFYGMRD